MLARPGSIPLSYHEVPVKSYGSLPLYNHLRWKLYTRETVSKTSHPNVALDVRPLPKSVNRGLPLPLFPSSPIRAEEAFAGPHAFPPWSGAAIPIRRAM